MRTGQCANHFSAFAHANIAATLKPKENVSRLVWAMLLHNVAKYAWTIGNIDVTRTMAAKSVKTPSQILGPEHDYTMKVMTVVAHAFRLEEQLEEAAEVDFQTMGIRKRTLGAGHISTLASQNNLAYTYSHQGRHEDAEELQVQVLAVYQTNLGKGHSNTRVRCSRLMELWMKGDR
ncbi:TPR 10 multi-domain protein [Pyrenophora teres f. teres]|uniref:TPR 10 multi-domain protein n=1 Tax=Pyrenophora teres f. teres TaxID=97479 RepID=A0A6S6VU03_9PLEO|nr:TPR 10 multi-domain protein [Pyrenophora teres f. teres]